MQRDAFKKIIGFEFWLCNKQF